MLPIKFELKQEQEYYNKFEEIPFRKTMDTTEEEYINDLKKCIDENILMHELVPEGDKY